MARMRRSVAVFANLYEPLAIPARASVFFFEAGWGGQNTRHAYERRVAAGVQWRPTCVMFRQCDLVHILSTQT